MRRKVVSILLIFACFLVQSALWHLFTFTTVRPNLMLVLIVSFGLMHGSRSGMLIGFISGILVDLLYGSFFGINALLYMYIGYFIGKAYQVFFDEDIRVAIGAVAICDIIYNMIFYVIKFIFGARYSLGAFLVRIMIPEVIITLIFTVILYRLFFVINKKLLETEQEDQESSWLLR